MATPMQRAMFLAPNELSGAAARRLHAKQFDFAPVLEEGQPVGVFCGQRPSPARARVASVMRPLDASLLVSADTPVSELVRYIVDEPFLFVVQGRRVTGFVTPSDLGSAPARTHYYLLLAGLEMRLAALVRSRFPDQQRAVRQLSPGAQERHASLAEQLRSRDEFLDDVAALSLMDLVTIAGKLPDLRAEVAGSGRGWGWLTSGLVGFRNDVMHPVREFSKATERGMRELAEFDERLLTLMKVAEAVMAVHPEQNR